MGITKKTVILATWLMLCLFFTKLTPSYGEQGLDIDPEKIIRFSLLEVIPVGDTAWNVHLHLETEGSFAIYKDRLKFEVLDLYPAPAVQLERSPSPIKITDPISKELVEVFRSGEFFLNISFLDKAPTSDIKLAATFLGCTEKICLFPHTSTLLIKPQSAAAKPAGLDILNAPAPHAVVSDLPVTKEESSGFSLSKIESMSTKLLKDSKNSFWLLICIVFLAGLLTNLTPCVYPMIPITLRGFSGQHKNPTFAAILYALGIVVTYTGLGIISASTGLLFGSLLASPWVSGAFALFLFLSALAMLGYINLQSIQNFGAKIGVGHSSYTQAFLIGVSAGFVAAPCTGPVLATLLSLTAQSGDYKQGSILMFVYSVGFAIPYIFLARSVNLFKKIRISPFWQLFVKNIFASIMFTMSFYFLRFAVYSHFKKIENFLFPLMSAFIVFGVFAIIYFSLPKLKMTKLKSILQVVCNIVLGFGIYLGLQTLTSAKNSSATHAIEWITNEEEAFKLAQENSKLILIDSWAEWCEACKKMDRTTYVDPRVIDEIQAHWIALKIDLTEPDAPENFKFQKKYNIQGLPTTIVIPKSLKAEDHKNIVGYVEAEELLEELRKNRAQ